MSIVSTWEFCRETSGLWPDSKVTERPQGYDLAVRFWDFKSGEVKALEFLREEWRFLILWAETPKAPGEAFKLLDQPRQPQLPVGRAKEEKPHATRSKDWDKQLDPEVWLNLPVLFPVDAAVFSTSLCSRCLQLSVTVLPKEEKSGGTQQQSRQPGV